MPRQRFTALGAGMLLFLGSETVLFGALIGADLHLRIHSGLTLGIHGRLPTTLPIINTVILMTSGVAAHYALTSYRKGRTAWFRFCLVATMVLGAVFLGGQAWEYTHAGFGLSSGLTGRVVLRADRASTAPTSPPACCSSATCCSGPPTTGGAVRPASPTARRPRSPAAPARPGMVEAAVYYWHFVDAVWVVIFVVVYLL